MDYRAHHAAETASTCKRKTPPDQAPGCLARQAGRQAAAGSAPGQELSQGRSVTMGPRAAPDPGSCGALVTMGSRAAPNPGLLRTPAADPDPPRDTNPNAYVRVSLDG